jgi:transcriptional regulator with XRE-family HTH domain
MTRHISEHDDDTFSPWESDAFAARLTEIMDKRKTTAYAVEKEAGIANSLIRKYMKGDSIPGADKLVALAKVLGVSISWLATGREEQAPLGQPQIDYDQLEEVTTRVLALFQDRKVKVSPKAQARIIRLVYEYVQRQGKDMDQASLDNVIELAAFR